MSNHTSTPHHFQVNLKAFIELLSDHLYSDPKVFLRELLQNAIDAITAREAFDPSFEGGKVELELVPEEGDNPAQLILIDNGVGLTEAEVHQFLAQIASSSKRDVDSDRDFIGQFGIGLLACFMVSNEIVMITQSAKGGPALEWHGYVDGSYSVKELEGEFPVGTQVFLRARADRKKFFRSDMLRQLIKHFGEYLPVSISLDGVRMNGSQAPWEQNFFSPQAARKGLIQYGEKALGHKFLDALAFKTKDGHTQGVIFIQPYESKEGNRHWVYLKRMLLSTEAKDLLPHWATFAKVVINTDRLSPMASRETFREDRNLRRLRMELGDIIKKYLHFLAEEHPGRMERVLEVHGYTMVALAMKDPAFFEVLLPIFRFETNRGNLTLPEFANQSDSLRYVKTRADFEQVLNLTATNPLAVILADSHFDREFIQAFHRLHPGMPVEELEVGSLLQRLSQSHELSEEEERFLYTAEEVLLEFGLRPVLQSFSPAEIPVILAADENLGISRRLKEERKRAQSALGGLLDGLASSMDRDGKGDLCFNATNPLVRSLINHQDEDVQVSYIQIMYLQSLMANHHRLDNSELRLMDEALSELLKKTT
jgi:molecular chaperone HtpG